VNLQTRTAQTVAGGRRGKCHVAQQDISIEKMSFNLFSDNEETELKGNFESL